MHEIARKRATARLLGTVTVLVFVSACGGRSTRLEGEDGDDRPSSTGGTAGTSAGGAGGGGTGGTAGRAECRVYAARYVQGDNETKCDFDRASLSLRCASSNGETSVTSWGTIDAAMSDNRPTGRITFSTFTSRVLDCNTTSAMAYDSLGRPLSQLTTAAPEDQCGNSELTYSVWDDVGRPLAGILTRPDSVGCEGQDHSFSYDDVNRRLVVAMTGGANRSCFDLLFTYEYDADGLLDQLSISIDGTPSLLDFVTLDTGRICK